MYFRMLNWEMFDEILLEGIPDVFKLLEMDLSLALKNERMPNNVHNNGYLGDAEIFCELDYKEVQSDSEDLKPGTGEEHFKRNVCDKQFLNSANVRRKGRNIYNKQTKAEIAEKVLKDSRLPKELKKETTCHICQEVVTAFRNGVCFLKKDSLNKKMNYKYIIFN